VFGRPCERVSSGVDVGCGIISSSCTTLGIVSDLALFQSSMHTWFVGLSFDAVTSNKAFLVLWRGWSQRRGACVSEEVCTCPGIFDVVELAPKQPCFCVCVCACVCVCVSRK